MLKGYYGFHDRGVDLRKALDYLSSALLDTIPVALLNSLLQQMHDVGLVPYD